MDSSNKKFTPFVFTSDKEVGVVSFVDCFEKWMDKAEDDDSIDLMQVFGMTWEELKKPWRMGMGKKRQGKGKKRWSRGGKNWGRDKDGDKSDSDDDDDEYNYD